MSDNPVTPAGQGTVWREELRWWLALLIDVVLVLLGAVVLVVLVNWELTFPLWGHTTRDFRPYFLLLLVLGAVRWIVLGQRRLQDRQVIALLVIGYMLFTVALFRPQISSDGEAYYAHIRSLALDHDFNFYNEASYYCHGWMHEAAQRKPAVSGYTYIGFSVGPAIAWIPFFYAAHFWTRLTSLYPQLADGYGPAYVFMVGLSAWIFGLLTILLLYRFCRRFFDPEVAAAAVFLGFMSSPQLAYVFCEGAFSHALSALVVLLFIEYWYASRERTDWRRYATLGFLAGAMMLVRWQNGIFLLLLPVEFVRRGLQLRQGKEQAGLAWLRLGGQNALMLLLLLLTFSPQMIIWKISSGSYLTIPQGGGYLNWTAPQVKNMLLSNYHGLYYWHPLLLLASIGGVVFLRRQRYLAVLLLVTFLLQVYMNSIVTDWWAGGFGQRRFEGCLLFFSLGLAAMLELVPGVVLRRVVICGLLLFPLWNVVLLAQCYLGPYNFVTPISITRQSLKEGTIKARDFVINSPLFNNLLFAPANGEWWRCLRGLFTLALLSGGAWGLGRAVGRMNPLAWSVPRWSTRTWWRALAGVILILALLDAWFWVAAHHTRSIRVLNTVTGPEKQEFAYLTVNRTADYQGGYMDERLDAEHPQITYSLDNVTVCSGMSLVSAVRTEYPLPGGTAIAEVEVEIPEGKRLTWTVRAGVETDAEIPQPAYFHSRARCVRATLSGGQDGRPKQRYQAYWSFPRLMVPNLLRIRYLLPEGSFLIDGVAFDLGHGTEIPQQQVYWNQDFFFIDMPSRGNTDYHHNPFVAHDLEGNDHFAGLYDGTWYWNSIPFQIPPPHGEGDQWPTLSTCSVNDATTDFACDPVRCSMAYLVGTGGLIRTKKQFPLVDVTLHYQQGRNQTYTVTANKDIFDYMDAYHPADRLLFEGQPGFPFGGRLVVVPIRCDYPEACIEGVSLHDADGEDPAGMAVFAITLQRSNYPVGAYFLENNGKVHPSGSAVTLGFPDIPNGLARRIKLTPTGQGYYIMDGTGRVHWFGDAQPLPATPVTAGDFCRDLELAPGGCYILSCTGPVLTVGDVPFYGQPLFDQPLAVDLELTPSKKGYYVLDGYCGVHAYGDAVKQEGPYFFGDNRAVDLELTPSGKGYYILDKYGFVHCYGDAQYFGAPWFGGRDLAAQLRLSGHGYVLLDLLGGVNSYGDVPTIFRGPYFPPDDNRKVVDFAFIY